jgi:hypothetical protein
VRSVNRLGSGDFGTWDINPVTHKFLLLRESNEGSGPRKINIVLNWTEELKKQVPAK